MVLQYAHHLAETRGPGTRVFAQIFVSLNGRAPAALTDDRVDLAAELRTLWPNSWVMPFQDTPMRDLPGGAEDM